MKDRNSKLKIAVDLLEDGSVVNKANPILPGVAHTSTSLAHQLHLYSYYYSRVVE